MHTEAITTRTRPDADTLAPGLRRAINAAAQNEHYFYSKALGRRFGGDPVTADRYERRSRAYQVSLSRLEDCAAQRGLLRRCCTPSQDCYHA